MASAGQVIALRGALRGAALALLAAGCASSPPMPSAAVPAAGALPAVDEFCAEVQHYMSGTTLPVRNVVHAEREAFIYSKAQIEPLQTEQYVTDDEGAPGHARMISCKMKTADHIRTIYGPEHVGEEGTCSAWNARTVEGVLARFTPAERAQLRFDGGENTVLDDDVLTTSGPVWLEPYPMAYVGDDGALHIRSKAMRNDWLDTRYFGAPTRFRGTRYCHLIAPEHLERLLTGDAEPDARSPAGPQGLPSP